MNQMNMAGMTPGNPPMRPGMPVVNNGAANGPQMRGNQDVEEHNYVARLNHYIYGYFIEQGMWDCARALKNSAADFQPPIESDGGDVNGADEKVDSKDNINKKPADLPRVSSSKEEGPGGFLLSWFELFWDVYFAHRRSSLASATAANFVQLSQAQARRNNQQQQQQLLQMPGGMVPGSLDYQAQMMRTNQMMGMNGDLRQRALQNNRMQPQTPQQQAQLARLMQVQQAQHQQQQQQAAQQMMQNQMRRDGSELNGQRPRTPSGTDHAASPSKRQRVDAGQFNGQQPRAMPPGMPGQAMMQDPQAQQAGQLLMNNGINPANLSQTQYAHFQALPPSVQQKNIQVYAQNMTQQRDDISKLSGLSDQGSPMTGPATMDLGGADFFPNPAAAMQIRNGVGPQGANGQGNHALQDYQMQLMLLEQQNKRRLLMARQENDTMSRADGQPTNLSAAPAGFVASGMSPSGSRGGPSPNPEQVRRGTPKIPQPGMNESPIPDGRMTGSPGPMNFNGIDPQMYNQMNGARMGAPPGSNPNFNPQFNNASLEAMQRGQAQQGRMPNGNWPPGQGPMAPQGQQPPQPQQAPQVGTPQQRNEMPPPAGIPAANNANGRTSSPAPPTPQPASKANPKGKKDVKDRKASKPTKKGSTASVAATPAAEADNPPATPTPSTPITPSHPNSFTKAEGQGQANVNANAAAPAAAPLPPPVDADLTNQMPSMDGMDDTNYQLFDSADGFPGGDLLEGIDFTEFLDTDGGIPGSMPMDGSLDDPSMGDGI